MLRTAASSLAGSTDEPLHEGPGANVSSSLSELGVPADFVAALSERGITSPTPIQAATIPDILAGRDVCGRAPTGSGKTFAFGLPLLARVEKAKARRPRALVLAPTRELAAQIRRELEPLGALRHRRVFAVYGGVGYDPQRRALREGVDVLIACPGRLHAELIAASGPTIVFCRTRRGVDRMLKTLDRSGVRAAGIHGGRSQSQRDKALRSFAEGRVAALVATDVAARGIHVDDVACVVHYDLPADAKEYLHRSGRTARAGASGVVVSLVGRDQSREARRLQRAVGIEVADGRPQVKQARRRRPARVGV
jgi:superfamily II DNA/RNA helicase